MTSELYQALQHAVVDDDAPLPTPDSRDWLINATSLEIAMFALDGALGGRISQDLGDVRRALERLNAGAKTRAEAALSVTAHLSRLSDDLADWLIDGRHRVTPQRTGQ
ncbi:hypothetical protein [Actinoallomurus rhizosphaericola]|uniref:hypothetical protein n=1 Tax=Actinoallomurus rhizosphaericola TaxID=2952536 RepID=UPI0020922E09|nr:hypothetical protein [Actinoallomurus rhizosphaericola]MCO5995740.1 hypothetical protein [Actinoallomurus rhizosphaericola]